MKLLLKIVVPLLVLGIGCYLGFPYARAYWKARNKPSFRKAEVTRGEIVYVVNSTGTVQPVLRVQVGTFVSGPIQRLCADYNQPVKKGELLAKIDPRIYQAYVARDEATLATRKAEVDRAEALLKQAENEELRANKLSMVNVDYISETELDEVKYNRIALEKQLEVAKAAVKQAEANLENSQTNLGYTDITSPVDGIVIDRKIDEGQTLAAQFQTPELFVVAPKMREKMHVFASVDEADIGLIRKAKDENHKVEFTVDAHPDDLFQGKIYQIRFNPTTVQNVVTYPVVVEAPNPELKLMPGMTATISFHIDKHEKVLKIPNAALRFYPKPEQVRPEDRKLLEGTDDTEEKEDNAVAEERPASERAEASKKRNRRHVWVIDGDFLKAIEIVTGLSDYKYTESVSGEVEEGQELVTGIGVPKS